MTAARRWPGMRASRRLPTVAGTLAATLWAGVALSGQEGAAPPAGERSAATDEAPAKARALAATARDRGLPEERRVEALWRIARLRRAEVAPEVAALLADGSAPVRREAVRTLAELGARDQFVKVLPLINTDADPGVRVEALRAARAIGTRDAVPAYIAALHSGHSAVRAEALEAARHFTYRTHGFAPEDPPDARARAARAFDEWHHAAATLGDVDWLLDALRSGSPAEKGAALRALARRQVGAAATDDAGPDADAPSPPAGGDAPGDLPAPVDAALFTPLLIDQLEAAEAPVRAQAFDLLRTTHGREFDYAPEDAGRPPENARAARHAAADKWRAWWREAESLDEAARQRRALDDADHHARLAAARAIGARRDLLAVPALINRLADPVSTVRAAAQQALERITDATVAFDPADASEASVARAQAFWRAWWARNQGRARGAWLCDALADPDPAARARAARALGETAEAAAAGALRERLASDPAAVVRAQAALSLGRLKDRASARALLARLEDHQEEDGVRMAASQALGMLSGEPGNVFNPFAVGGAAGATRRESNAAAIRRWRRWVEKAGG